MILDKIVAYKKKKIEEEKSAVPLGNIISQITNCNTTRDFKQSIRKNNKLSIIAEIKKASPSKGIIAKDFNPLFTAKCYEVNKVEAISVLTEDKFFQGQNQYLSDIKKITSIPLLRKDFIIDPYQIYQSKVLGAHVILLIVSILSKEELNEFQKLAKGIGLQCLVEVHNQAELEIALDAGVDVIGINNRDLKTFKTTLETTANLMAFIPKDQVVISESGIHTREDMEFLEGLGVDGVLIGESLMKAKFIDKKLIELRGW